MADLSQNLALLSLLERSRRLHSLSAIPTLLQRLTVIRQSLMDNDPNALLLLDLLLDDLLASPAAELVRKALAESIIVNTPATERTLLVDAMAGGIASSLSAPVPEPPSAPKERDISAWFAERESNPLEPLHIGQQYTLRLKVGQPVSSSLLTGQNVSIPESAIPPGGLATHWVVLSNGATLSPAGKPSDTRVDIASPNRAEFNLLIPEEGDTLIASLNCTPLSTEDVRINILIYTGEISRRELYRECGFTLAVLSPATESLTSTSDKLALTVAFDVAHTPAAQSSLRTTHEWTTPPGRLSIAVVSPQLCFVQGESGSLPVGGLTQWHGASARIAGSIANVRSALERFREVHEKYLNAIEPNDLTAALTNFVPAFDWRTPSISCSESHKAKWEIVSRSPELRDLALEGNALLQAFFPNRSDLRAWLDGLIPGQRIDLFWQETAGQWIPSVPWGLMYSGPIPAPGESLDPTGFWGLRYRIAYSAWPVQAKSKALGAVNETHRACLLYSGDPARDPTAREALVQTQMLSQWPNQVFLSTDGQPDAKQRMLKLLAHPEPDPLTLIYLFCQCTVGDGNDPVLRFANSLQPANVLRRNDLRGAVLDDQPLIFANACTTAASDPYIANEMEQTFFNRECRAFLGTESKVPIELASRFATAFFSFFFRSVDAQPMAAGEAVAQSRLLLWHRFCNIGGLFYTYVNQYELFSARDEEVAMLH